MKIKDLFWGLLFIAAAILVIFGKLGFFTEIGVFEIVATIALVAIMIKSIARLNFWGILIPAALLCTVYADELGMTDLTPGPVLLAAILASIGLSMIFRKSSWRRFEKKNENYGNVVNHSDGNVIRCSTSFNSSMRYINSPDFERADLKCSFGAMKVYFDSAKIPSGRAIIALDVAFSGVELYIPKEWKVVNEANATLGGIDEKNRRTDTEFPVVTLTGNVSFGGVEIIYI